MWMAFLSKYTEVLQLCPLVMIHDQLITKLRVFLVFVLFCSFYGLFADSCNINVINLIVYVYKYNL